jgi:hypothetical protein
MWVFKNRELTRILTHRREVVTYRWSKVHNEEVHNLYSSPNIRMTKSSMARWAGHYSELHTKLK